MSRWWAGLLAVVVSLMALYRMLPSWKLAISSPRLPHWDEASRVIMSMNMAESLKAGQWGSFLRQAFDSSPWPPLFHALEAPLVLLFGSHYHVAAAPVPWLFFATVLAAYGFGVALGGEVGLVVGVIGAALIASSPMFQAYASLIMLEIPGVLLMLLSMIFYVRYRRHGNSWDARWVAITTFLLFLLKYNYGVLWAAPLAINEMGRDLFSPRRMTGGVSRVFRARAWRRPFWILVALYAAVLAVLALKRGGTVTVGGREIAVSGLRDPILVMVALLALRFLWHARSNLAALRAWLLASSPLTSSFVLLFFVPCALWLAPPTHLKSFLMVLANRTSNLPLTSVENLLFYPRSFLFDYSSSPLLGMIVLALGLAGIVLIPKFRPAERIVPVALAVGLAFTTLHRFKVDRFFFLVVPLIWLSCALVTAILIEAFAGRRGRVPVLHAVVVLSVAAALIFGFDAQKAGATFHLATTSPAARHVISDLCAIHATSRGTVVIGYWAELSPALVEWYRRHESPLRSQRPITNVLWYGETEPEPLLGRIAADSTIEKAIFLDLPVGAPAYRLSFDREFGWMRPVGAALATDPRFRLESEHHFEDTGYRVRIYSKVNRSLD